MPVKNEQIALLAEAVARKAHAGQFRHDGVTPYITHPEAVAAMFDDPNYKAVAWLHDVLEDTNVTEKELRDMCFPDDIVDAIVALTQQPGESYEAYHRRLVKNEYAVDVKVADMCHNMMDEASRKSVRKYAHLIAHIVLRRPLPASYDLEKANAIQTG